MYPIDSISSLSFNLTIVSYTLNIFSIFNEKKDGSFTPEETKMLSILRIASFDIAYRPLFLKYDVATLRHESFNFIYQARICIHPDYHYPYMVLLINLNSDDIQCLIYDEDFLFKEKKPGLSHYHVSSVRLLL